MVIKNINGDSTWLLNEILETFREERVLMFCSLNSSAPVHHHDCNKLILLLYASAQPHDRFWAHFMSSALGRHPVTLSMIHSSICQKQIFSRGQLSQPVVMQKYVSCGATWWIRWWRRGKIMWYSWRNTTHVGKPK